MLVIENICFLSSLWMRDVLGRRNVIPIGCVGFRSLGLLRDLVGNAWCPYFLNFLLSTWLIIFY